MTIKEIALKYFKAGVTVFPAVDYKKYPALNTWKEYQTKKPTPEEVENWFSVENVTGILALCGEQSNITVVDDDDYKTGNPLDIESPLEATTTSGGRHIYFRYSPEVSNQNVRTGEQEFEIQNNGKLVMMPPSMAVSKTTGKPEPYKWLKEHHDIKTLPILTAEFTAKYQVSIEKGRELSNLLEVDLGQQHVSLRSIINKFLFQTPESEWETKVYPVIVSTAEKYNPPHPPHRVLKLWEDCKKFVRDKKVLMQAPKSLNQVSQERSLEKKLERNSPSTGYGNLDKIIKGFIPGHLYVLTGNTNVGKTSLGANFTVAVARQKKKVLYLALEPDNTIIDYLSTVAGNCEFNQLDKDWNSEFVDVYTKDQITDIDHMMALIKNLPRYDLIIIDHIGYFESTNGQMTKTDKQSQILKQLVTFAKKQRSAVMVIAHVRKDTGEQPTIDDISGSGAFKQDATDVIAVFKETEKNIVGVTYLDTGYMVVLKTKSGMNGYFKINFKYKSAKIYDPNEPST